MNGDTEDEDDGRGAEPSANGQDANRPNVATDAIQNFVVPEGYIADFVPGWSKNRSIIFDYGIKATATATGKVVWFCLCSSMCQTKSSKGIGIAIKG